MVTAISESYFSGRMHELRALLKVCPCQDLPAEQADWHQESKCEIGKDIGKLNNGLRVLAFGKQDCK